MSTTPSGTHRFVAISGSSRPSSYTARAMALAVDELRSRGHTVDTFLIAEMDLHLPGMGTPTDDASRMTTAIKAADGVLLATPEYHGSYAAGMKLAIENLGFPSELAGKPVALLGVAAGRIGAIKALEHLRSVCAHVGALVLPGPISIAGVQQTFDDAGRCTDPAAEKSIRGLATALEQFVHTHITPRRALEALVRDGVVSAERAGVH